jgi:hypothetical protein
MDYVAGNLGLNSFFKASVEEPAGIYAGDFNGDGSYDAIPTLYLPDENGKRHQFPANVRDDFLKQLVGKRKKFDTYVKFAKADINDVLTDAERQKALHVKATNFASSYIQNNGNGTFAIKPLPPRAQLAPLNGMVAHDVNNDGNLDLVLCGNDYGNEVVNGRMDALNGVVLLGQGNGTFLETTLQQSGFFVPGDSKAIVKLVAGKKLAVAASQNRDKLQLFTQTGNAQIIRFGTNDVAARIQLKNGKRRKEEVHYGTSFLSQSARFLAIDSMVQAVEITDNSGHTRSIKLQ